MPSLASTFRSLGDVLGNERAVTNAAHALAVRHREDWLVAGLARRLDQRSATQPEVVRDDSGVSSHAVA